MADDHILICRLEQVESASSDLCHEDIASDFTFDPCNGAAHNRAFPRGLCAKELTDPGMSCGRIMNQFHAPVLDVFW